VSAEIGSWKTNSSISHSQRVERAKFLRILSAPITVVNRLVVTNRSCYENTSLSYSFAAFRILLLPGMASADSVSLNVSSAASVPQGNNFTVDVNISGVTDLYDFQFDLSFDPTILQVTNIAEGAFLPGAGATFFLPGFIDNSSGTITFNADTLEAAIPGANGAGTLIEFSFDASSVGTSFLNLDNIICRIRRVT